MIYKIRYLKPHFEEIINNLRKKNKSMYNRLMKKIDLVVHNPKTIGHPLRYNLRGMWETHVANHYVLIYHIDEKNMIIRLVYFDEHDHALKSVSITIPYLMEDLLKI